jgi:hypothetical protein
MASTASGNNRRADQPKAYGRSKVSNGSALFVTDSVAGWSRRLRDLIALHVADLGGEDVVSTAEHSICRRIAAITTELELLERKFALKGKGAAAEDLDLYLRGANSLRRMLESIGLKRVARDVTPPSTLDEIARDIEAEDAANNGAADAGVE